MRGVANPIGMKVGPSMEAEELLRLTEILNPANEKGRLTLIARMGATRWRRSCPPLLRAVRRAGATWSGSATRCTATRQGGGYKTRPSTRSWPRCAASSTATRAEGTIPGGVHVEMTGRT
jgi:3-deoxy-7-phosphoheptulonate synthase